MGTPAAQLSASPVTVRASEGASLTLEGLRKTYGHTVAADVERLEVRPGELLSLLGPSGCGKTTTLRCIAGLILPDAGRILIRGRDVVRLPTHQRNLGMVFQNYAVFPHMTVYENVAYGLENRGLGKAEIKEKVLEALQLVELEGFAHRYRHQLSGGQQQRVALARSIVYQPDVLLLDEPLSNLDAKLRKTMRFELRQLQQRLGLTTVFVTHDQQEALSLSDTVVVMSRGRVEQIGTPREVYERPRSTFVADFIGSTNLLPAVVKGYDAALQEATVEVAGGGVLRVPHHAALASGGQVTVLVKPEKVRLVGEPVPAGVTGRVAGLSYLGPVIQYQVELGDRFLEVVASSDNSLAVESGTLVGLAFEPDCLRLLEA